MNYSRTIIRNWHSAVIITMGVAGLLAISGCRASSRREVAGHIPGLNRAQEAQLNGVWEPYSVIKQQAKQESWKSLQDFSWGEGKLSPEALLIDLGANPPYLGIMGIMTVEVHTASKEGPDNLVFNTTNMFKSAPGHPKEPQINRIELRLNADGTIMFIGSIGEHIQIADPEQYRFFRTYGPGVSQ